MWRAALDDFWRAPCIVRPMGGALLCWLAVLVLVLVVLVACAAAPAAPRASLTGGAVAGRRTAGPASAAAVVDMLNLTHWLVRARQKGPSEVISFCDILNAIDVSAPRLRSLFPAGVTFVTKDRDGGDRAARERARAAYQAAAARNRVGVCVVEQLPEGPVGGLSRDHIAKARDDFYVLLLARRLGAAVLSHDSFADAGDMVSGALDAFRVAVFDSAGRASEDHVNPKYFSGAKLRGRLVRFGEVLPGL